MDCPKCGSPMKMRHGKRGAFYGCSTYPRCNGTAPYKGESAPRRTVDKTISRNWSPFQLAIFDAVGTTNDNLVVEAVAGSGKTTTSVAALNYASRYPRVAFVAFNKSIARDFADKVPQGVHASTFHSLGRQSILAVRPNAKMDEYKNFNLFEEFIDPMPDGSKVIVMDYRAEILRLVSLVKNTMSGHTPLDIRNLADYYSIDIGDNGESDFVLDTASRIAQQSISNEDTFDFDDMIYWCATGRVEPLAFDFVVTDEMQDTNQARLDMLMRMLRESGRSLAVGDRKQAIYGWSGAAEGAMDVFKQATNAIELALSITYRCPKSHVELAQQIVPQIQAREDAPEGIVGSIRQWDLPRQVHDGDMVLCRVNAPLVRPAFQLLAEGRKAIIVGKDIGASLVSLVTRVADKAGTTSATQMLIAFDEYVGKQCERLERQGKFGKAEYLRDQLETTEAISEGCDTVEDVEKKILSIFKDEREEGVRFSSVHRAKGLEANRTFILRPELMPHPKAVESNNPEALASEMNVKYVALTRSKAEMCFVG